MNSQSTNNSTFAQKHNKDLQELEMLIEMVKQPVYKGAAMVAKLGTILGTMNSQTTSMCGNTYLVTLLCNAFHGDNVLCKSHVEAKKSLFTFSLDNDCIHACPIDGIIFHGIL